MSDIEIQELYAASYRRLLGQLIAVTGSVAEAEDVVQEAFVRGLDRPQRLSTPTIRRPGCGRSRSTSPAAGGGGRNA